jgi:hypothetical protein
MPITPTQFRLTDSELANLDKLAARYGLASRTAAVRLAITIAMSAELKTTKQPKPSTRKVKK